MELSSLGEGRVEVRSLGGGKREDTEADIDGYIAYFYITEVTNKKYKKLNNCII
jgi:hypothetical protein